MTDAGVPSPDWKIYYGDGSTFAGDDSVDAALAPSQNVMAIAQNADIAIGRKIVSRMDFYWLEFGEWFGGDLFGLFDYLTRVSPAIVKFGRVVPRETFETILNTAVTDPALLPKVAWTSTERR